MQDRTQHRRNPRRATTDTDSKEGTRPHLHAVGVEEVVRPRCHDHLGLLLHREVGPREVRVNVLLVQLEDLVVGDGTRVGVVHDAGQLALAHLDGERHELGEHGHRVGDVDDLHTRCELRGQRHELGQDGHRVRDVVVTHAV